MTGRVHSGDALAETAPSAWDLDQRPSDLTIDSIPWWLAEE